MSAKDHLRRVTCRGEGPAMDSAWPFWFLPLKSSEGVGLLHVFQKVTLGQRKEGSKEESEFASGISQMSVCQYFFYIF